MILGYRSVQYGTNEVWSNGYDKIIIFTANTIVIIVIIRVIIITINGNNSNNINNNSNNSSNSNYNKDK